MEPYVLNLIEQDFISIYLTCLGVYRNKTKRFKSLSLFFDEPDFFYIQSSIDILKVL